MAHIPVLLSEVLQVFQESKITVFFEGTVGAGGHAKALLEAHPEIDTYFACDRDPAALDIAKKTLEPWKEKIRWIYGPFAEIDQYLDAANVTTIDGFFIDIGVSSMQFDEGHRGFSFREDAPLDMRMDPNLEITAEEIINNTKEEELARIFYEYGEEFRSRAVAKAICIARKKRKIRTTLELADLVASVLGRRGKIHPATKVFQALRIAVNDELEQLKKGLKAGIRRLSAGGRLAVISFHSLEDRIVKRTLREDQELQVLTKKPLEATREEMKSNPRSRSAKLRSAEKG